MWMQIDPYPSSNNTHPYSSDRPGRSHNAILLWLQHVAVAACEGTLQILNYAIVPVESSCIIA